MIPKFNWWVWMWRCWWQYKSLPYSNTTASATAVTAYGDVSCPSVLKLPYYRAIGVSSVINLHKLYYTCVDLYLCFPALQFNTCVFHPCELLLRFSALAFPSLHNVLIRFVLTIIFRICVFHCAVNSTLRCVCVVLQGNFRISANVTNQDNQLLFCVTGSVEINDDWTQNLQ